MEEEICLTDLIDRRMLQKIQDALSRMIGIAAVTTDSEGANVTQGSNFSDFCICTRNSPIGNSRCEQCDKRGAEMALSAGKAATYTCHAGLKDFAAPIVVSGRKVGSFVGGQVLTEELDLSKVREYAKEIGVDPDEYVRAAQEIKIITQSKLDNAAEFLYTLADVLSEITFSRHLLFQANLELGATVNLKSDFLANMSHEIRTPMNAVIGMAEMALREDLTDTAREYINQIKVAGKSLLTIINDILDFSKIESGKMDIIPDKYEPMSILNDVANIIITRLADKEVDLVLDVSPDLPCQLLGDNIRIKQIILNLANNAAKFTSKGKITLTMEYVWLSEERIELRVSIADTGIGIKKQDLDKLFQTFTQVDSKRNRNIEGTGLGLAISKQLLTLMNGNIWVESEYGKGSKFSFSLPQQVVNKAPSVTVQDADSILATSLIANTNIKEDLQKDIENLGVEYRELTFEGELYELAELAANSGRKLFCFIDPAMFSAQMERFIKEHPDMTAVLFVDYDKNISYNIPNLIVTKRMMFTLNIAKIFNYEDLHQVRENDSYDIDFTAPDAEVLVVDDNAVNLTVVEGLLEPVGMKIDTALCGKDAIDKISSKRYDLVFMDHMMPEMDGVETTHIIRRFHKEYEDVPIIALSANAVDGAKERFRMEGMNDFVPKPIELRMLLAKLKQWLPDEKVQKVTGGIKIEKASDKPVDLVIGDLDVSFAIKLLGSEKLFRTVLKDYYRVIGKKAKLIQSLEEQEDWKNYTIEVHALKSSSRQIGAISLSEKAAALEKAGNAEDGTLIHGHTKEMLEQYLQYQTVFQPFCEEEAKHGSEAEPIPDDVLNGCFSDMKAAIEELDMDLMEDVIGKMEQYTYTDWQQELFAELKDAVGDVDVDKLETLMHQWEERKTL